MVPGEARRLEGRFTLAGVKGMFAACRRWRHVFLSRARPPGAVWEALPLPRSPSLRAGPSPLPSCSAVCRAGAASQRVLAHGSAADVGCFVLAGDQRAFGVPC